jgi:DNA-binding CsgD family transcriptional regulator
MTPAYNVVMAERSVHTPASDASHQTAVPGLVDSAADEMDVIALLGVDSPLDGKMPKGQRLVATAVLFGQGISASEISRRFGISREQTRKDLRALGFITSSIKKAQRAEIAARISSFAASGKSASQIAEQINETEMAVRRIGKEFGIRLPRPVTKSSTHGTVNSYNNGCRCPDCRQANTVFCAGRRALRRSRVAEMPPEKHGTISGYENWGCRCDACSAAETEHRRVRFEIPEQTNPRKAERWQSAEDDLVGDYSLTARQLAIMLNRTISSVNARRRTLRVKSLHSV